MVSVMMPAYNMGCRGIERAIESVIGQTWQDWELIVVDDGSTDGTGRVAEWYAARDSRIRVRHQANLGLPAARNAGYWLARGDWIAHLDADDEWLPNKLELQMAVVQRRPEVGICYGFRETPDGRVGMNYPLGEADPSDVWAMVRDRCMIPCQSVIVRRSIIQVVGGNSLHPDMAHMSQDWHQWLRAAAITRGACVAEPLYRLGKSPESLTARYADGDEHHRAQAFVQQLARRIEGKRKAKVRVALLGLNAWRRGAELTMLDYLRGAPEDIEIVVGLKHRKGELVEEYERFAPVESITQQLVDAADVVHWQWYRWDPGVSLAPEKVVISEHSVVFRSGGGLGTVVQPWMGARPSADANLPMEYKAPAVEIPLPVTRARSTEENVRSRYGISPRPMVLGLFPLQELKGWREWLQVARMVNARRPYTVFAIVGARRGVDPDYEVGKEAAEAAGCIVIDSVPESDVASLIRESACVLHCARSESVCRVVIEAQLLGTPVVAMAVGGLPQHVEAGLGVVVAPGAVDAAAEHVYRYVEQSGTKQRSEAARAAERVALRHDLARVSAMMAEVYRWIALQTKERDA